MFKYLTAAVVVASWIVYTIHNGHIDGPEVAMPVTHQNVSKPDQEIAKIDQMSESQIEAWAAKRPTGVTVLHEKDTVIHYDKATLADLKGMMNGDSGSTTTTVSGSVSSGSNNQAVLNSGDGTYSGSADDNSVGSVSASNVPAGYHWVNGYTRKNGTHVKGHAARNAGSSSSNKKSSNYNLSTPTFTRSHDVAQRAQITKQNFPGKKYSGSDPTILLGPGN